MEIENRPINLHQGNPQARGVSILCAVCELSFIPSDTKTNICQQCILNTADITLGITKEGIINYCKFCHRYLRPPWTLCERESKELLSICLKRLRGLTKVKIIDAAFVYSDPSSKRIKVRLTVQKEVLNNTNVQQTFMTEFAEHYQQCDDCKKEFTPHTWGASVQIRQKVAHKKTFFYLEQLLLKHNANDKVLKIENVDDGLDFFYKTRSHAASLIDYLDSVLPIRVKSSKQLVSHDQKNNTHFYKYCFSVELPKICKDDLVILPAKLAKELGGVSRLQLCFKVSEIIHLLDPVSLKVSDLNMEKYSLYENEFIMLQLPTHGSEFTVVDAEKEKNTNLNESYISASFNRFIDKVYKVQVMRGEGDFDVIQTKTFLGDILRPGCTVLGYDISKLSLDEIDEIKNKPEIILVRKMIDKEQRKNRIFKLKRMAAENKMEEEGASKKKKNKHDQDEGKQFEEFLDDVAKDKEMRKNMNLYRDEENIAKLSEKELKRREKTREKKVEGRKMIKVTKEPEPPKQEQDDWESDEDDGVKLDELMRDLTLNDKPDAPPEENALLDDFISKMERVKIEK